MVKKKKKKNDNKINSASKDMRDLYTLLKDPGILFSSTPLQSM